MARKRYTPAPRVPPQVTQRFALMLEVMAGRRTVTSAANELGMSRNHFQTLMHRGLAAMVESIAPQHAGRPAKPREMVEMQTQIERLKRENEKLQSRVGTTDKLLQAASSLLQGRIRPVHQARKRKRVGGKNDDSESEPRRAQLGEIDVMRRAGLSASLAATIAGVHPSTVRRWKQGSSARSHLQRRSPGSETCDQASDIVRALHGQVGAESLSRSVVGLSRRAAARVKARTLAAMEHERKRALTRVRMTLPGVMRGLDGMHFKAADGPVHALVCADAAIPYRTAVKTGKHYDTDLVAQALRSDIEDNGAPLVYRLDRASPHDAPLVRELLDAHQVLVLHGPPHCPRFYGQLERQNREHRAWEDEIALLPMDAVEPRLREALHAVNSLWRRRTLGWKTASEAWDARRSIDGIDRAALREEVIERAARIGRSLQHRGKPADLARRLAIEQALQSRGYLRQTIGGWC